MLKTAPRTQLFVASTFVLLVLFLLPGTVQAAGTEVPLYIKYRYEKQTGRKWYDASPERQDEFIREILEKRAEERKMELRSQILKEAQQASKERVKDLKKMRMEQVRAAREQRQQEKVRQKEMRKDRLKRKKEEMSRRIQLRKKNR